MARFNAMEEEYELVRLKGHVGLFSDLRIDPNTLPENLFMYELRSDDDGNGEICEIAKSIWVNFWGTFITGSEFDLGEEGYLIVDEEEEYEYLSDCLNNPSSLITIEQFVKTPFFIINDYSQENKSLKINEKEEASMPPENGTYAITEQGDLGLGLTPVDESALKNNKPTNTDTQRQQSADNKEDDLY